MAFTFAFKLVLVGSNIAYMFASKYWKPARAVHPLRSPSFSINQQMLKGKEEKTSFMQTHSYSSFAPFSFTVRR